MSKFYRSRSGAVRGFVKDNAFYLILALTLAACIGYGAFVVTTKSDDGRGSDIYNDGDTDSTQDAQKDQSGVQVEIDTPEPVLTEEPSTAEPLTELPPQTEPIQITYIPPIIVEESAPYSGDNAVYSETLKDWRTHPGIDYSTENEEPVYSVAEGTVKSVTDEGIMGRTVVIEHPDGVCSIYQSLAENVKVSEGEQVVQGQFIGYTGDTASGEAERGRHLHFAMTYEGKYIDPHEKF